MSSSAGGITGERLKVRTWSSDSIRRLGDPTGRLLHGSAVGLRERTVRDLWAINRGRDSSTTRSREMRQARRGQWPARRRIERNELATDCQGRAKGNDSPSY